MSNGAMDDDAEQFSLRWNNFHNNLSCGFHELLEEKDLVDVTLACDGQYVQAHKIVLTVCSPYFKALFKVNPNTHPIVILKDVNFSDLQAILQFMYRGEVNVRQEDLTNFLKTAEVLKIKGLTGDDKGPGSSRQSISQESSSKSTPNERAPSPPSAPPPTKRKRTQEPPPPMTQAPQPHVRTPSPAASAPQAQAQPSPLPTHSGAPNDQSDVEYIEVSETKVEPADYVEDDDQYSRDDLLDEDISMSASDPLSSSSQMLVPPPLMAGPSTSRDSSGKEALQGLAPFAGVAGPSSQHDAAGPSSQELTSQDINQLLEQACTLQDKNGYLQCILCGATLKKRTALRIHLQNQHGADKYERPCSICGKLYKNRQQLRIHFGQKHKNQLLPSYLHNQ